MESNNAHHQNFGRFVLCPNVSWVGHWIHPAVVALLGAHLTAAGFALILSVLMPALEEPMSAWTCRWCNGKADPKIVPPRPRIPAWKGDGADSEEKREPVSDIDTAVV